MNVDAIFDQDAVDAFIVAVARQTPADAIRLNDPEAQRLATPNRLCGQAADQYDGEDIPIVRNPLDQLIERGLKSNNFVSVTVFGHSRCLGLGSIGRSDILMPIDNGVGIEE